MAESKLKILQLAPRFPFPEDDGGKIGIASCLKELHRAGCEVDFVTFSEENIPIVLQEECKKYCNLFIIKHSTYNSPKRIFTSLFKSKALYFDKHINSNIKKQLKEIIGDKEYDIIHADHSAMGELGLYAKELTGAKLGLRLHNIEWKIWHRYVSTLIPYSPKAIYLKHQAQLLREGETELLKKIDVAFPITDVDKAMAQKMAPGLNVITASGGIYLDKCIVNPKIEKNPYELIIATSYGWIHNVDGIRWFIKKVLPGIRKELPQVKLTLIGKNPPNEFRNIQNEGVYAMGYVPEVYPYLSKASIYVAPLFVGSGIRIKILEALAMKLPVIATTISAEGITQPYDNGLYISDFANEWITTIVNLLKHPETIEKIGETGRKFIEENYSCQNNIGKIIAEYKKLAKNG